jgi:hypothetical protein
MVKAWSDFGLGKDSNQRIWSKEILVRTDDLHLVVSPEDKNAPHSSASNAVTSPDPAGNTPIDF